MVWPLPMAAGRPRRHGGPVPTRRNARGESPAWPTGPGDPGSRGRRSAARPSPVACRLASPATLFPRAPPRSQSTRKSYQGGAGPGGSSGFCPLARSVRKKPGPEPIRRRRCAVAGSAGAQPRVCPDPRSTPIGRDAEGGCKLANGSPDRVKHFSMIRGFHLADFFTLANAACGVGSIFTSMGYVQSGVRGQFLWAAGPVAAGPRLRRARRPHRPLAAEALRRSAGSWTRWPTSSPSGWRRRRWPLPPACAPPSTGRS